MPDIIGPVKIYCIEDAHTRSNTSGNTHDSDINKASVAVGRHSSGYQCYGFFKFAPHGIPDNAVIVSAEFGGRVYERLQAKTFSLTARPCSGAWEDDNITYKTMPTSTGVSDKVAIGEDGTYFSSDITAIAQAWFSGKFDYDNGLYITSSEASSYKRVYSCTASNSNKPYISLTYYVPASKPTLGAGSAEIAAGTVIRITTNRLSSEYKHTLTWKIGSRTGAIASGVTDAYTWTLTAANVSTIYAALPAAESGTMTVVCETFDAAGVSLGTETASMTVTIPKDVVPKVASITATGLDLRLNCYLQGISRMQVDVTAEPGEGAEIASVIVTVDGVKYSGTLDTTDGVSSKVTVTTGRLTSSGTVRASATVTDTRGRAMGGAYHSTIPVYAYSAPKISGFAIGRCSEDGSAEQIDGEHLRLTLDASSTLIATQYTNPVAVQVYAKLRSDTDWTLAAEYGGDSTGLALANAVLPGVYSPLSSYDVRVVAVDKAGTEAAIQTVIPTATSLLHFDAPHKRVTAGRVGESLDPEHALITALDFVAEAGVSLHGADIEDGRIDLPDGGMIAAGASFDAQAADGAIRTLESVTVTATGKNLIGEWEHGSIDSTTGADADASGTIRCGYVPVIPGVTYAISRTIAGGSFAVRGYDAGKNYIGSGAVCITLVQGGTASNPIPTDGYTAVFTVNAGVYYLRFLNYNADLTALFQMEIGTESTDYEPYTATELTCPFGAPMPAAEVDFAAGVWRETWGYIGSYAGETVPDGWISSTGALSTGAQVAYPLASPVRHAITPQLIAAPAGPNFLTTNADAITGHVAGGRIFYVLAKAISALA